MTICFFFHAEFRDVIQCCALLVYVRCFFCILNLSLIQHVVCYQFDILQQVSNWFLCADYFSCVLCCVTCSCCVMCSSRIHLHIVNSTQLSTRHLTLSSLINLIDSTFPDNCIVGVIFICAILNWEIFQFQLQVRFRRDWELQ